MPIFNDGLTVEQRMQLVLALRAAAVKFEARAAAGNLFSQGKADICRSIADRAEQRGFASERQLSYARSLVRWAEPTVLDNPAETRRAAERAAVATQRSEERDVMMNQTQLARIAELFAAARSHNLTRPKIRLQRGEWRVEIYPTSSAGRYPGDYYVRGRSMEGRGRRLYCGRIAAVGGLFHPSSECPADVLTVLREFAADPLRVASAYGHAIGSCCFCGRTLTDARSVAMGYGPICAEHYGLEWGEQRAAQSVTVEMPDLRPTQAAINASVDALARALPLALLERQRRALVAPVARDPNVLADQIIERQRRERERERELRQRRRRPPDFRTIRSMPQPTEPGAVPLSEEDEDKHFM